MAGTDDVSYERLLKINRMVGSGAPRPKDLTPAESKEWDQAAKFYGWAESKGITVDLPGEAAGAWA